MIICVLMRYGSKRLPGKVLINLAGKNSIEILKAQLDPTGLKTVLCCPVGNEGDLIEYFAKKVGFTCYRGSLNNVLERMVAAAETYNSSSFVRVTGDDLFVDPVYLGMLAQFHVQFDADLTFTDLPKGTETIAVKTSFGRKLLESYGDNTEYWDRQRSQAWKGAKLNFCPLSPIPANEDTFALELDTYENLITTVETIERLEEAGVRQPFHLGDLINLHAVHPFPENRDPVDRSYFDND